MSACACICLMCAYPSKSSAKYMHSENYAPVFEYIQGYISVASSVLTHVSLCVCLREEYQVCACVCVNLSVYICTWSLYTCVVREHI